MRSFLEFLLFSAAVIAILVLVAGPLVARPLVADVVRSALPFEGADLDVAVEVDGFDLLGGHVREIRLSGAGLVADGATIGSINLTARRVGLISRDVEDVRGRIDDLTVALDGGGTVAVASVDFSGSSSNVTATAQLSPGAAESLVAAALAEAGLAVDRIALTDEGFELHLLGQRITVALAVADGAVVLPSFMGIDALSILGPAADDPWRIIALTPSSTGLQVEASLDAGDSLAGP
jgi:hypothetical protein